MRSLLNRTQNQAAFLLLFAVAGTLFWGCQPSIQSIDESNAPAVHTFPLDQVRLLAGPFQKASALNVDILLNYEPDRLLSKFRTEAGLLALAPPYEGWEGMSLAGHSLGHYLSACALMYQSTGDQQFLERVNYIVAQLDEVQNANGNGYIGAAPGTMRMFEEEVAKGEIRSQSFDLNGTWAPFYTYHKIMAGLRDAYRICSNSKALAIEKSFADWMYTILKDLTNDQIQDMLNCEFGGVQETLVDLSVDTQEEKYLQLAQLFHHEAVLDPLSKGDDILPGIHGNTQIPKLIASTKLYEQTSESSYEKQARFFWDRVVNHHSYVTGGHGNHEYFGAPDQLNHRLSTETTETCNVYNMLKLSQQLFSWSPKAAIADFYERALFNHILATQHPTSGKVMYFLSLEMGGHKEYQDPFGFTCCVGSGMETHSKHGEHIYYSNATDLYVSQYIASELDWKEKGIQLTQTTAFPQSQETQFRIQTDRPQTFRLLLRYPHWASDGIQIRINGKPQKIDGEAGSFVALEREWQDGDVVQLAFPFSLRYEAMPDNPQRVAFFYGPIVLAGLLGPEEDTLAFTPAYVPAIVSEDQQISNWLIPENGADNVFKLQGVGRPRDIQFKPLYQVHDIRYSVYFDLYNLDSWAKHQEAMAKKDNAFQALEKRTMDLFIPGDEAQEDQHQLKGEKLNFTRNFKGRNARGTERGGWLSFDMAIKKGQSTDLVLEYWGGFTGSKTFDILVNDVKVATENISGKKDGFFLRETYAIPEEISSEQESITVRFSPHVGHRSGPFFEARTVYRLD